MSDIYSVEADPRFAQCNRELFLSLGLWVTNIIVVIGLTAWLGQGVPASDMSFTFGLPAWYLWGAFGGSLLFCLLSVLMVRFLFKDMPLDGYPEDDFPKEAQA